MADLKYEVVATPDRGTPAKSKTQARKIISEKAKQYEAEGWAKVCGSQLGGVFIFERDGTRHGLIVRPWL